ncbi:LysR family transcriptional regulator [Methylomarinum vadi]|uniref:LysR family transcriptional regulator n=1 Tax=Methylomarinum vadi TaxID=438855 RepID=UPI0004DF308B|nr:LysR family transcriptional regulator [Methylomarinum vadi]
MDKLNNMRVFCRIVELGTFAAVAREMNLSAMMISKYVSQLEQSLGVVLLNRTTRSLNLTEAGQAYYTRSKQLLEDLAELDESTAQLGGSVKGVLKISAPIDFGGLYMVPAIESYQQKYPDVKILMSLDNKYQNLRDGRFDMVILVTDCLDPGVVARKITDTELGTYASPEYIEQNGAPQNLEELAQHRCLHYVNTPHGDYWVFNDQGETRKIKIDWYFATNNGRALSQAATLGMGIMRAPKLSVHDYLQQGRLVEVLPEYKLPSLSVYATYLQRRFYPAKLSSFVEFLIKYFAKS